MEILRKKKKNGLDSLELKALSVPSSLRFLIGVEYDIVLCVTEVGRKRPFSIRFPECATVFQKLLGLCAERFGIECQHMENHSIISGIAEMPVLRYADYLPGALHVEELLACLQVVPSSQPKRDPEGKENAFIASFIDYSEFVSDAGLADVHGIGLYLTLDYGLSLATHSHLIAISFHGSGSMEECIKEFQQFSEWNTFDLRFEDENNRRAGGIIVMPSIQDANDIFEKYEDEEEDDFLPFTLRPLSPMTPVPCVEDAVLRKMRVQHWNEVERQWEKCPRTKNTVVVYNLYEGATQREVLAIFENLPIASASFVEDNSPKQRRRVFITLSSSSAARDALALDGKSTRGKTLRVQVAPPYIEESRRGHPVVSRDSSGTSSSTVASSRVPSSQPDVSRGSNKTSQRGKTPASGSASPPLEARGVKTSSSSGSSGSPKAKGGQTSSAKEDADSTTGAKDDKRQRKGKQNDASSKAPPSYGAGNNNDRKASGAGSSPVLASHKMSSTAPPYVPKNTHVDAMAAPQVTVTAPPGSPSDATYNAKNVSGNVSSRSSAQHSPSIGAVKMSTGSSIPIPAPKHKNLQFTGAGAASTAPREYHAPKPGSISEPAASAAGEGSSTVSPHLSAMNADAKEFVPSPQLLNSLTPDTRPRVAPYDLGPSAASPPPPPYLPSGPALYGPATSVPVVQSYHQPAPPPYSLPPPYEPTKPSPNGGSSPLPPPPPPY